MVRVGRLTFLAWSLSNDQDDILMNEVPGSVIIGGTLPNLVDFRPFGLQVPVIEMMTALFQLWMRKYFPRTFAWFWTCAKAQSWPIRNCKKNHWRRWQTVLRLAHLYHQIKLFQSAARSSRTQKWGFEFDQTTGVNEGWNICSRHLRTRWYQRYEDVTHAAFRMGEVWPKMPM